MINPIIGQQPQAPVAERVTSRSRLQKSGGSHGLFQINFQSLCAAPPKRAFPAPDDLLKDDPAL
jgi:hypothetical protein